MAQKSDINNKKDKEKLQPHELTELFKLEEELASLKEKYNIEEEKNLFRRAVDWVMEKKETQHPVARKKDLWLALLTGWCGGHRFYAKQYFTAVLSVALFWTGIPGAMAIIDIMIALPKTPDKEGIIMM